MRSLHHMELVKQPFIYWSKARFNYDVTAITVSEDRLNIITGSVDGNIISWNLNDITKPFASYIISSQSKSCIKCIETFSEDDGQFFVASQENGELFLFDADDGHTIECLNSYKCYFDIKVNKQICINNNLGDGSKGHDLNSKPHFKSYLYCTGAFSDIIVLDAVTLNIVFKLGSRFTPDWISSLCFLYNNTTFLDVIIGITLTGCVKLWTLTKENTMEAGKYIYENEGKSTGLLNCHTLTYCRQNPKIFIMITSKILQVYNVASFTKLCFRDSNESEPWAGGSFISKEYILVWTETVKAYLFQLLEPENSAPESKYTLKLRTIFQPTDENFKVRIIKPKYCLKKLSIHENTFTALFCASGDEFCVWNIDCALENLGESDSVNMYSPMSKVSLVEIWPTMHINTGALALDENLIKIAGQDCVVTSSLYLRFHDYYVYGTSLGAINILQRASIGLLESFANYLGEFSKCQSLVHHDGPITSLLYPHSENPNYDSSYFLSGGVDGNICLWELNTFSLLHLFAPQQASISSLTIVLDINSNKVDNLILSIAEDKSVAVLNLSQRKCLMMASEHSAPVDYVIWLHFKGFMLVGCIDGSLYVWQIANGMLDRCASGVSSELIYSKLVDKTLWPNVPKTMHNNRRFVRDMGNAITQDTSDALFKHAPFQYPLRLNPLQLSKPINPYQIAIYNLVYFSKILCEPDYSRYSTPNVRDETSFDFNKDLIGTELPLLNGSYKTASPARRMSLRALSLAGTDINQLYYNASPPARKRSKMVHEKRILHLILSHNHPWHQDKSIDSTLHEYLEIQPPHNTVPSFCLMASNGNTVSRLSAPNTQGEGHLERMERLMRLLIIANTLEKNIEEEGAKDGSYINDIKSTDVIKISNEQNGYSNVQHKKVMDKKHFHQLKRFYLKYFLSSKTGEYKILLDVAVSKLQATCPQVRRAAQEIVSYVLTTQLKDVKTGGHNTSFACEEETIMHALVEKAIKCLTFLLDQIAMAHSHPQVAPGQATTNQMTIPISGQTPLTPGNAGISKRFMHRRGSAYKISPFFKPSHGNGIKPNSPSKSPTPEPRLDHSKEREGIAYSETENGLLPSDQGVFGTSFCERYNLYGCYPSPLLALLLLGYMSSKMHEKPRSQTDHIFKERFGKYFTLQNPRLPVLLSNLLSYLITSPMVLQASPRPGAVTDTSVSHHQDLSEILLHYENNNVARVIAMRVLSDAFQIFEPFLDLSSILMRLLDICYLANQVALGEECEESLAEIAKNCLTKIAFLRPAVFITILNKEINKQMMQASNIAPLQNLNIANQINALSSGLMNQSSSVIINAREIIYNIIESLITHKPLEILNLLSEALDIYVYCGGAFGKVKDWEKLLAPFIRFPQIAFNAEHKLVAVGTQKGQLLVYDFKTIKPEVYATCHKDAIVAVSFSPDSKYLATFSYPEGVLVLWQMTSSLFGIGTSQAKYVKSRKLDNVPRISLGGEQEFKIGKIVWINLKVLLILFADGTEHKLHL